MALNLSLPVLVVDDASTMIRIITNMLGQIGFRDIDEVQGGATALAKMRTKRYGLVISDWNMEPITGIDLLRQVRADPDLGETPFIMVTAETRTKNVIAAKDAGVSNYIVKPFTAQMLKAKIEAVFAERPNPLGGLPSSNYCIQLVATEHLKAGGLHQVFHAYALKSRCKALLSLSQCGHYNRVQQPSKFPARLLCPDGFGYLRYIENTDGLPGFGQPVAAPRSAQSHKNALAHECVQNVLQVAPR